MNPAGADGFFRRRRFLLISTGILVVLVVIAVAAGLLLVLAALNRPGEETAKFLPDNTQAYFTINLRPGNSQIKKARAFTSIFEDSSDFEDKRDEFIDELWEETGIDVIDDVLPWLGTDITFAPLDVAGPEPEWIMLLQTKDPDAAEDFLDDLVGYLEKDHRMAFGHRRYRGAIVYPEAKDELSFGVTDNYVLVGGSEDVVEDTIRDLASPPLRPLSEDATFLAAREQLPSERSMLVFIRSRDLLRDVGLGFDPFFYTSDESFQALGRNIPKVIMLSGSFIDQGIRFDSYWDTPRGAVIPEGENHLNTAKALPEDTLFLVSAIGIKQTWRTWIAIWPKALTTT